MRLKTTIFLSALFIFGLTVTAGVPDVAAQSLRTETIAAVVNDDAVSESDVTARIKMIIASSGMPDNKDIREKLTPQVMNLLIEEKIKVQEADRLEIEILQEDIEQGFAAIAAQNKFTPDQFKAVIARQGVPVKTLHDQIRAQIAWSRVVQKKLRPQINITDNEVDAVINRMEANQGKNEYLVSEIFLPVEKPGEEPDVRKLADRLTGQLVEGRVPFQRLAGQFSQAAGASRGGDLGWVQEGQLPESLDRALSAMKEGDLSQPVRSLAGYHILLLRSKRMVTQATIPSRDEIFHRLGMERLERLQRGYLLDLKTAAFIEQRA